MTMESGTKGVRSDRDAVYRSNVIGSRSLPSPPAIERIIGFSFSEGDMESQAALSS